MLKKIFSNPLESTLCVLLSTLSIVTFSQVIARYIFQAPLSWSEELARFLLLWLAMMSAAYAFKIKASFSQSVYKN
jgi:TRAP-type C4-dicarboxylate transport system permease small subunit